MSAAETTSATVEPAITNSDLNALMEAGDHFLEEAEKCARGGSFQAACVMAVAAFEARLLATAGFLEVASGLRGARGWPKHSKLEGDILA